VAWFSNYVVGYGDSYPTTHLGRLVVMVTCIWGNFILSLLIVTLTAKMKMLKNEKKPAFNILERQLLRSSEDPAGRLITAFIIYNARKKGLVSPPKETHKFPLFSLFIEASTFKKMHRTVEFDDKRSIALESMERVDAIIEDHINNSSALVKAVTQF